MTLHGPKPSVEAPASLRPQMQNYHHLPKIDTTSSELSRRSVQGVLVLPTTANTAGKCHDAVLKSQKIDRALLKDSKWKSLELPKDLGLPLQFIKWPTSTGGANYNHLVQVLSINFDCSNVDTLEEFYDADSGETPYPPIRGGAMLVREDHEDLTEKEVKALALFIDTQLETLIKFGGGRWRHKTVTEFRDFWGKLNQKLEESGAFLAFEKELEGLGVKVEDKEGKE